MNLPGTLSPRFGALKIKNNDLSGSSELTDRIKNMVDMNVTSRTLVEDLDKLGLDIHIKVEDSRRFTYSLLKKGDKPLTPDEYPGFPYLSGTNRTAADAEKNPADALQNMFYEIATGVVGMTAQIMGKKKKTF